MRDSRKLAWLDRQVTFIERAGASGVMLLFSPAACTTGSAAHGAVLTLEEAGRFPRLRHANCTSDDRGPSSLNCPCQYLPAIPIPSRDTGRPDPPKRP